LDINKKSGSINTMRIQWNGKRRGNQHRYNEKLQMEGTNGNEIDELHTNIKRQE
jgi:hypothetical protein